MNKLEKILTSLEVAEMVEKKHSDLMRDIRNIIYQLGEVKASRLFQKSIYTNKQNKQLPCFLIAESEANKYIENAKRKRVKKSDSIYIVKHKGMDNYYKIGITCNFKNRLASFNNASPLGIETIYLSNVNNAKSLEKEIHQKYKHKNTILEWFILSKFELKNVINLIESEKMGVSC